MGKEIESAANDIEISNGIWIRRRETPEEFTEIRLPAEEFQIFQNGINESAPIDPLTPNPIEEQVIVRETIRRIHLTSLVFRRKVLAVIEIYNNHEKDKIASIDAAFNNVSSLVVRGNYRVVAEDKPHQE